MTTITRTNFITGDRLIEYPREGAVADHVDMLAATTGGTAYASERRGKAEGVVVSISHGFVWHVFEGEEISASAGIADSSENQTAPSTVVRVAKAICCPDGCVRGESLCSAIGDDGAWVFVRPTNSALAAINATLGKRIK